MVALVALLTRLQLPELILLTSKRYIINSVPRYLCPSVFKMLNNKRRYVNWRKRLQSQVTWWAASVLSMSRDIVLYLALI